MYLVGCLCCLETGGIDLHPNGSFPEQGRCMMRNLLHGENPAERKRLAEPHGLSPSVGTAPLLLSPVPCHPSLVSPRCPRTRPRTGLVPPRWAPGCDTSLSPSCCHPSPQPLNAPQFFVWRSPRERGSPRRGPQGCALGGVHGGHVSVDFSSSSTSCLRKR